MKKIIAIAVVVLILSGGAWWHFMYQHSPESVPEQVPYTVPTLSKEYYNSSHNFSLNMPADFTAQEISGDPDGTPYTIVLQDQSSNGIQIAISPFDEDTGGGYTLTQARIQQDVPDMQIMEPQVVEVGNNYKGLAFKSNNEAFGGASREVWFVFRGNLYQISTYERLDNLLKGIFQTWQFQ
ncbi:MAG TPA: hypothetical protein VHD31_01685 [Candidatus Paceibacterota bacterium]|nr:hypothetical protein [Candidatus Paceibacterota bacterium]